MPPERWKKIKELLDAALARPAAQRGSFLEQACGGDGSLRREVEDFLERSEKLGDFFEEPVWRRSDVAAFLLEEEDPLRAATGSAEVGCRIGPYKVLRLLGRGGMGAVYLAARQDDFKKQVALKLIKRGMDTDAIVRRFENERQILAHLDHPHIARLLDGGTTADGLPYFVMEYVEGEPIDRYCDARELSIRDRLELFRKLCTALQASHQSLVVHRDLKPGNILVTADGVPKLLDFGIAKLLEPDASTRILATAKDQRPMTPEYASPEQVKGQPITTASDVYSLGVLLFHLLTGHSPYHLDSTGFQDMIRVICEEDPKKPSAAVQHATEIRGAGGTAVRLSPESVSRARASDPRRLHRRLKGDLDSIALKAMRKAPQHRYRSVEQLAEDVRRHLKGLPVRARTGSLTYTAAKFVKRHHNLLGMTAALLLLVVGFTTAMAFQVRRTERALARAETVSEFLEDLFEAANPNRTRGKEVTVTEMLDVGREKIEEYREEQPRLYASLATTMGHVYLDLGSYEEARTLLEDSLAILRRLFDGRDHPELAVAINDLAAVFYVQAKYREAEELFREGLSMRVRLFGEAGPEVVRTVNNLATVVTSRGDYEEAEMLYRRGLAIRQRLDPPDSEAVATSLFLLGTLLLDQGDYERAEPFLRQALATRRKLYGSEHTGVAKALNNLGMVRQRTGDAGEARELYREALDIRRRLLGENHPEVASTETNLATLLVVEGRYQEAESLSRRALRTLRDSRTGHWRVAYARSVLGSSLVGLGRYEEAESHLSESYPILVEAKRQCTAYPRDAIRRLIDLYDAWDRPEKAAGYRRLRESCSSDVADRLTADPEGRPR
ncbi:MAG: serine/threonine protein kinase [bacterium]|nr:serine/threonine protein kinase [bacterium]